MKKNTKTRNLQTFSAYYSEEAPFFIVDGHPVEALPNGFDPFGGELLEKCSVGVFDPYDIWLFYVSGFIHHEPNGAVCFDITAVRYNIIDRQHQSCEQEFSYCAPKGGDLLFRYR